jgi:fibro-slime domain-containing protein
MKAQPLRFLPLFLLLLLPGAPACSATSPDTPNPGEGDGDGDESDGDSEIVVGDGDSVLPPRKSIETVLPSGFSENTAQANPWECMGLPGGVCFEPAGGVLRQGSIEDVPLTEENECRNVLRGIVRDFEHSHIDFGGDANGDGLDVGLVQPTLGDTRKPIPTGSSAVANSIQEWFENGAGGNVPYVVDFWLEPVGELFIFDSSRFFPLEGVGTPSGADNDGIMRNFGFTTELHSAFQYQGGEVFTFTGDDDVFIYINTQLAVDLGGVHSQFSTTVNIDQFATTAGMTIGEVYNLDLFHAERNPTGSNFRIETSLDFRECGVLEGDIVVR